MYQKYLPVDDYSIIIHSVVTKLSINNNIKRVRKISSYTNLFQRYPIRNISEFPIKLKCASIVKFYTNSIFSNSKSISFGFTPTIFTAVKSKGNAPISRLVYQGLDHPNQHSIYCHHYLNLGRHYQYMVNYIVMNNQTN